MATENNKGSNDKLRKHGTIFLCVLFYVLLLSSCIENNDLTVFNKSDRDIVVDYYVEKEIWLDMFSSDDGDDIEGRDEDEEGAHRITLVPGEFEFISAGDDHSVYVMAAGIIFKFDSSSDIEITDELINERALEFYRTSEM